MQDVTATEVKRAMDEQDVVVIDVLSPDSYRKQHLPGALNLPGEDPTFEQRLRESVPDKDTAVVFYCSGPACNASPDASRRAEAMGYTDVREFRGGLEEWANAGHPFEKGLLRPAGPAG